MDARIDHGGGIVPSANDAVDQHQHARFQKGGIRTYGGDAGDGAGSWYEGRGEGVPARTVVDVGHVGDDGCG